MPDSAAAARRSANDFALIFNSPARGDDTVDRDPRDGRHGGLPPLPSGHRHLFGFEANPTAGDRPSASASVASYRHRHRVNEDRSDIPRLDQLTRRPDIAAIDDEQRAVHGIEQETGRSAKTTQVGQVGRRRHDERLEIVRSVVVAEALESSGPSRGGDRPCVRSDHRFCHQTAMCGWRAPTRPALRTAAQTPSQAPGQP